jgi:hypothetical protein
MENSNAKNAMIADLLLKVGIVVGAYFVIVKPITNKLGLTKSAEDRANDAQNEKAVQSNGWTPNFYKEYNKTNKVCLKNAESITAMARRIYNAWGNFNDDEEAIFAVFRDLRSLVQLSQLCEQYKIKYNTDLLTRLKTGLSDSEFSEVSRIVNKLPINVTC